MAKELVKQPSALPTRKVAFYTAGGIVGIVALYLLRGDLDGAWTDPIVTGGVPLVFGFVAAWLGKDRKS